MPTPSFSKHYIMMKQLGTLERVYVNLDENQLPNCAQITPFQVNTIIAWFVRCNNMQWHWLELRVRLC